MTFESCLDWRDMIKKFRSTRDLPGPIAKAIGEKIKTYHKNRMVDTIFSTGDTGIWLVSPAGSSPTGEIFATILIQAQGELKIKSHCAIWYGGEMPLIVLPPRSGMGDGGWFGAWDLHKALSSWLLSHGSITVEAVMRQLVAQLLASSSCSTDLRIFLSKLLVDSEDLWSTNTRISRLQVYENLINFISNRWNRLSRFDRLSILSVLGSLILRKFQGWDPTPDWEIIK